ncbi:lipid A deacylase LpxR family protein [Neoroseomonas eburnea]|nr:lipid A deacylase LpxR family protein [Neoroseomonas eburnea]
MAVALASTPTLAQERAPGDHYGTFAFTYENDLLAGTDRFYTSGFQLAWRSSSYDPPSWLSFLTDRPSLLFPEGGAPRWGLSFGQNIFTPADTQRRNPDPLDRPYAGWLYGGISINSATATSYGSIELQIGVVGPSALGEETQNNVHDLLNIDRALGWDYQLKDEPGINLVLARQWRVNSDPVWRDVSFGVVPSVTASLGNVQTYASAGLMLRFGNELDADFGPPRMRPSIAGSAFYQPDGRWGWYVFAAGETRVVGHDIFLDGNTWRESRSVDREPVVAEGSLGVAIIMPFARLTMTYTARSREFETQRETAQYGSASLSFRF